MDMVGRVHRCIARPKPAEPQDPVQGKPGSASAQACSPAQYKYRDADKWRTYMREYMRKRRSA